MKEIKKKKNEKKTEEIWIRFRYGKKIEERVRDLFIIIFFFFFFFLTGMFYKYIW